MVRVPNPPDLEALPLPMPNQRRYAPSFDYLVIGGGMVGLSFACAAAGAAPRAATTATIRAVIKAHRITESPALAAGKRRSEATRSPPPS